MAQEIELKLALSRQAAQALPQHPLLADLAGHSQRLLNTYYDTADLRLKGRRVALRFRKKGWQWLLTVKSAEAASGGLARRSEWETPAAPGTWDFTHVDDEGLRADLESAIPDLEPVFTTHFRRTAWNLPYRQSLVEVALDRGWIKSCGRKTALCEVELELVSGQVADLFALTRELQATLPLRPSVASKAERGYALFLDESPQPFKAKLQPLAADMLPLAAFRQIALACLEQLQRNEAGITAGADPEYIHQARVALRRLRSAIKVFAPLLPGEFTATWSQAWQLLAAALGEARNWDVFISETLPPILAAFPEDRTARQLLAAGRRNARQARTAVRHLLALEEYPRLITEFTAALVALDETSERTLGDFAFQRLASRARQVRRIAERHRQLSDTERHAMRIAFKKLRYGLEFFGSLLRPRRLKPYLAVLTQLQEELGLINDHVTAMELVSQLPGRHRPGPIMGWLHGRHALLLADLPESLETWLAHPPPWKHR